MEEEQHHVLCRPQPPALACQHGRGDRGSCRDRRDPRRGTDGYRHGADIVTRIGATNIPVAPPPPKPPEPAEPRPAPQNDTVIHAPKPARDLVIAEPRFETAPLIIPPLPSPRPGLGLDLPKPGVVPGFDPVAAKPRNDPAAWLSSADYRPAWMRREMTGLARFRLEIAANGRVTGCIVTGSTGHAQLDTATCQLVAKRARFEPARGAGGEAVAGSYDGAVLWQLPE